MGIAAMTADELNEGLIARRPPRHEHHQAIVATADCIASRRDLGEGQRKGRQAVFRGEWRDREALR